MASKSKWLMQVWIGLVILDLASCASSWSYEDTEKWKKDYEECKKSSQSPVDVVNDDVVEDDALANGELKFEQYEANKEYAGEFKNNGHTVQFTLDNSIGADERPRISGPGLSTNYILEQFHFHWGNSSDGNLGSEHTIDGKAYPVEIHFVHYNGNYSSFTESLGNTDGLAVIGFMFQLTKSESSIDTNYDQVTDKIVDVASKNAKTKLLPAWHAGGKYYRYQGSLTTPPCLEIVTWTLFEKPIPMIESMLDKFRLAFENKENKPITNNFRPVQPLNGRQVKSNTKTQATGDSSQQPVHRQRGQEGSGTTQAISITTLISKQGVEKITPNAVVAVAVPIIGMMAVNIF